MDKKEKIKFYCFGANGTIDPRLREGCGGKCSDCGKKFSYWDDLQLSPTDEKIKCANCKGIEIDLIKKQISMEATLKHIEQYLDLGRTCYKLTYELNDSLMILDYCVDYYFKMEHLVQQSKELVDKAKEVAESKDFETIQLYFPQNISTDEVSFYKENGFEFYPNSPIKMYYKLTNKNK
jgi:DNA-directed RNA polymerase subunit RPC12/RpoP